MLERWRAAHHAQRRSRCRADRLFLRDDCHRANKRLRVLAIVPRPPDLVRM